MKPFKFFQNKPERVFSNWMGRMDDYFLGGITTEPTRPLEPTDPEYYNTDEFVFCDVTQIMFDPIWLTPYKHMLFRHIEEGNTVQGQRIESNHPMWNFPDII